MTKALFLDRDGVINIEKDYLYKIEEFEFIDGVFETCRYFQSKGYIIVVITNQSGIDRGYYSHEDFKVLSDWMVDAFKQEGIDIAKVYYCPHHPSISGKCSCRKPNSGMIVDAQEEWDIDLSNSILVGDKISDIEAGQKAGVGENYLIATGHDISAEHYQPQIDNLKELIKG